MGLSILTLIAAKKYIKESLLGGGAVVGKNVKISSITPIDGGNEVTFAYTLDSGQTKNSTLQVMNGENGFSPKITTKTSNNGTDFRIQITDINGTTVSPNLIPPASEVDTSKFIKDINIVGNYLLVTKGDGSIQEIKLPTISGGNANIIEVATISVNELNEIEIIYDGELTEELPTFEVDPNTGELSIINNGNCNIIFNVNDDNELEVTY